MHSSITTSKRWHADPENDPYESDDDVDEALNDLFDGDQIFSEQKKTEKKSIDESLDALIDSSLIKETAHVPSNFTDFSELKHLQCEDFSAHLLTDRRQEATRGLYVLVKQNIKALQTLSITCHTSLFPLCVRQGREGVSLVAMLTERGRDGI